jgi:DNA-binding LytR/AlgR family response regulator
MLHSSLKALEGKLPPAFIRVHRSYIISLSRIDRIEESLVYIGNKAVPVSDAYWDNLRSKLNVF